MAHAPDMGGRGEGSPRRLIWVGGAREARGDYWTCSPEVAKRIPVCPTLSHQWEGSGGERPLASHWRAHLRIPRLGRAFLTPLCCLASGTPQEGWEPTALRSSSRPGGPLWRPDLPRGRNGAAGASRWLFFRPSLSAEPRPPDPPSGRPACPGPNRATPPPGSCSSAPTRGASGPKQLGRPTRVGAAMAAAGAGWRRTK